MDVIEVAKIIFYVFMIPLVFFSAKFYIFGLLAPFMKPTRRFSFKVPAAALPKVTVQIPVYNDPVVINCIKSCLAFDYPRDRFEVVVADDSTDETAEILSRFQKESGDRFKIVRRASRRGFKAGALNDATKRSNGDVIVIFDSDYKPPRDFLRKIVVPFIKDEKVAFVQARWGYLNYGDSLVSRLASIMFNAFHKCSMPVEERIGTAIFCGSGGAVKRSVLAKVGGWNERCITEDIDLTMRVLQRGYKQVYLRDVVAHGEVPTSLRGFVKQQQRWAFGTTKALMSNFTKILASPLMTRTQKIDTLVMLMGFFVFPFILGVTLASAIIFAPWFGGSAQIFPFDFAGFTQSLGKVAADIFSPLGIGLFLATSGYFFYCTVSLIVDRKYKSIALIPIIFFVGFIMEITNTLAVFKALLGMKHTFYRTPKVGVAAAAQYRR